MTEDRGYWEWRIQVAEEDIAESLKKIEEIDNETAPECDEEKPF